jgi:hypothetical protein
MRGFLQQLAQTLWRDYGDKVSSMRILFPSKRARLFFNDALAETVGRALWQPRYETMDDIVAELSGLRIADKVKLITELYKVYGAYHQETFDTFYYWGDTLLSDFDSVDRYMSDAGMLFANISDLKAIESDTSYLTEEQRAMILRFWRSFGHEADFSREKRNFISVWNTLLPIYNEFRANLSAEGIAYAGMAYRVAAEKLRSGEYSVPQRNTYVVAGFNALSTSEKAILDYLQREHDTLFFWDYDNYYIDNTEQEAGLFLRENIKRYPQTIDIGLDYNAFGKNKRISVVSSPSDSLQCKYVAEFLAEVAAGSGRAPDKETAIVLTDENLLMPVLHAIPDNVKKINVTMGYPLKLTLTYSFVERVAALQMHKRHYNDRLQFYHKDVLGLLRHPYIAENVTVSRCIAEIENRQQPYIDTDALPDAGKLFSDGGDTWQEMADYISQILTYAIANTLNALQDEAITDERKQELKSRTEFLNIISEHLAQLHNTLINSGIDISVKVLLSLLRRTLQRISVPYQGEPLEGVQVMGILETRNLDFENVLVLSMNDDNFPGNPDASPSFIPYNLRVAYGLPTAAHHEGVYAYYFYRLLQRADNIHLAYSSQKDESSSGEPSRYIYQIEYETNHKMDKRYIDVDVRLSGDSPIVVEKSGDVWHRLSEFLSGERSISPTAFTSYMECSLKFYFKYIAGFGTDNEISEAIDDPVFGSIFHEAARYLYKPLIGNARPQQALRRIIYEQEETAVNQAINHVYLKDDNATESNYGGNLTLLRDTVVYYLQMLLLPYDASQSGYRVESLEQKIDSDFAFSDVSGVPRSVIFEGRTDRVDMLDDGRIRIIDYKTGSVSLEFPGLGRLFTEFKPTYKAIAQILLYAMMYHRDTGRDVLPAIYSMRQLNNPDFSPSPVNVETTPHEAITSYIRIKEQFEELLATSLSALFDVATPFTQCKDVKTCEYCDFKQICRR